MITLKNLLAKTEDALFAIYDYCDNDCENCVFDSCMTDMAYNLHIRLISGIAKSFGIVEDTPFRIKPTGIRTITESVEEAVFTLSNGNIYNGSGHASNTILDLLIEGTYEVILND